MPSRPIATGQKNSCEDNDKGYYSLPGGGFDTGDLQPVLGGEANDEKRAISNNGCHNDA